MFDIKMIMFDSKKSKMRSMGLLHKRKNDQGSVKKSSSRIQERQHKHF